MKTRCGYFLKSGGNQGFMLISDLLCNTLIGCDGELNQSEYLDMGLMSA